MCCRALSGFVPITLIALFAVPTFGQSVTTELERLFDSDDAPPGRSGSFSAGNFRRLAGDLVFIGSGFDTSTNQDYSGVYRRLDDGTTQTIIDSDTSVGGLTYDFFDRLQVNGDELLIVGRENLFDRRLLRYSNSSGIAVEPGTTFETLRGAAILDSDSVHAFASPQLNSPSPLLRIDAGVSTVVADSNTTMPGHNQTFVPETFNNVGFDSAFGPDGEALFVGFDQANRGGRNGLYQTDSGTLTKLIDNADVPASIGSQLLDFLGPDWNEGRIGFGSGYMTSGGSVDLGLYELLPGGDVDAIVDTQTLVPGTGQMFQASDLDLRSLTLGSDAATFLQTNNGNLVGSQMWYEINGEIGEIIGGGDILDGQTVEFASLAQSIGGDEFVLPVRFDSSPQFAYYRFSVTAVPEPSAAWVVLALSIATIARRQSRRFSTLQ